MAEKKRVYVKGSLEIFTLVSAARFPTGVDFAPIPSENGFSMPRPFDPTILEPGDAILYFRRDLLGCLITLKTWTRVAHIEIYRGNQISYSSRCESGVNA